MLQNALDCREAALCIFGRRRQPPHTHFWCPCQWLKEPSKKGCFKKLYLMKAERNSPSVETLGNACLGQCGQKQLEHAHHAHLCIAGTSANAGCPCAHWSSLDCVVPFKVTNPLGFVGMCSLRFSKAARNSPMTGANM